MSYAAHQTELRRMIEARRQVARGLHLLARQFEAEAVRWVNWANPHPRRCGQNHPGITTWRASDERLRLAAVRGVQDRRAPEVQALQRKLERQTAALEAFITKHRLNVDPAELRLHFHWGTWQRLDWMDQDD